MEGRGSIGKDWMTGGTGMENGGGAGRERGRKLGRSEKGGMGGGKKRGRAEEGFTTANNIRRQLQVLLCPPNEEECGIFNFFM